MNAEQTGPQTAWQCDQQIPNTLLSSSIITNQSLANNVMAAPSLAATNQVSRSDAALEYLIAHTQMAHANAITRRASLGSTSTGEALAHDMPYNTTTASLASLSHVNRTDECIDYLIAHTERAHAIAVEESIRKHEELRRLQMMRRHSAPYGSSTMSPFATSMVHQPFMGMPPQYCDPLFASRFPGLPIQIHRAHAASAPAPASNPDGDFRPIVTSEATHAPPSPSKVKANARVDLNSLWGRRYGQLVEFKEAHGHCNVPQRYAANVELGRWVKDQRTFKVKGKLNQERIELLEEIGFQWKIKCHDDFWEKMCADLSAYKEANGHCNVSMSNTDNVQLARWVDRNRRARKNGKISEEKVQQLNELGFCWTSR
ncbi:hypothetical protein ACHAWO_007304 [Cyclotella atomus]|uniref:Helicase-associated domain-containing protein n=1 Tax=Cyclotella atomus TaxID=382360 RepID=A0ABD3QBF1_9STRA